MRRTRSFLLGLVVIAGVSAARPESARAEDTKAACVRSYEQAQRLRLAGDLLPARAELNACSQEACPELVHRDCLAWLREVEAAIPSVIVSARTPRGVDRTDVRVFVDGELMQESLTGRALEVKPGQRKFRFEPRGAPSTEQDVLINTGEKNRLLRVVVQADPRDHAGSPASSKGGPPLLSIGLFAVGVAAAGAGIALDVVGSADLRELRATCAPRCAEADVSATRAKIIAGDTLLGVGIVSVGAAVLFWLTRDEPGSSASPPSSAVSKLTPFRVTF